jgi:hypothetical protein
MREVVEAEFTLERSLHLLPSLFWPERHGTSMARAPATTRASRASRRHAC